MDTEQKEGKGKKTDVQRQQEHEEALHEAERIRRDVEKNEPNQLTNDTGMVRESPMTEMDYD